MNTINASSIATSAQAPLTLQHAIDAVETLVKSGNVLSKEERAGIERLSCLINAHADRTLTRLLNGHTEANYVSLLNGLNDICESEYNDWLKNNIHSAGDIEQRVECVRQNINFIKRHEELGIEFVTTDDARFMSSIEKPRFFPIGTRVYFRAGRWVIQARRNTTAYCIPSNKVRRIKPDVCTK